MFNIWKCDTITEINGVVFKQLNSYKCSIKIHYKLLEEQ